MPQQQSKTKINGRTFTIRPLYWREELLPFRADPSQPIDKVIDMVIPADEQPALANAETPDILALAREIWDLTNGTEKASKN